MNRILTLSMLIGLLVVIALQVYQFTHKSPTAYVELGKIYSDFEMKKEMEGKYSSVSNKRKGILDSLEMNLKMLSRQLDILERKDKKKETEFLIKREEYLVNKKRFDEDNETMTAQYNEQITKQLNQYVKDFGKENEYEYIFGAEGSGSLMYAMDTKNITAEVTRYVNEKYKGAAK